MRRGSRAPWATVVGVVGHAKQSDLAGDEAKGKYYYPLFQQAIPFASFIVRSQSDPHTLPRHPRRRACHRSGVARFRNKDAIRHGIRLTGIPPIEAARWTRSAGGRHRIQLYESAGCQ